MKRMTMNLRMIGIATVWLAAFGAFISAQDKYTVKGPGGLASPNSRIRGMAGDLDEP